MEVENHKEEVPFAHYAELFRSLNPDEALARLPDVCWDGRAFTVKLLGRAFAMTTVLSSLLYPVLLEVCRQVLGDSGITENMLLNTVFGGLGLGLAMGIVMRAGASTGGMDIPPLILKKLFSIPVAGALLDEVRVVIECDE